MEKTSGMTNEREKILAGLAVIILLGMTGLTWFKGEYSAVAGYDFATSLKPLDDLTRALYLWDERLYAGSPSVLTAGTLPYFIVQYLLEQIFGSLYKGQMVFFTLILLLPGLAMYWFLFRAFDEDSQRPAIAFFGAVFYMFNTFVVVKWNRGELLTLFSYGFIPVFLALIDRGLRGPLSLGYWIAVIAALFFFPASLGHTADFLIIMGIVLSFALWRGYSLGAACVKRGATVLAASIMLSLWWALPLVFGMSSPSHTGSSFTGGDIEILHYYSSWATLLNLMKMWFFSMYATTVEFSDQFYRPGTLIFPIVAFSALLFRKNGYVFFFSIAAIIGLWLAKGTAPPLSAAYEWMYLNLPYFFIFRAPSRYFPVIYTLALAVLTAYTLGKAFELLRSFWPGKRGPAIVLSTLTLSLFFFHAWPIFSRDTIFKTGENDQLYPSIFIDLPESYAGLNAWLGSKDNYFRVHSFNNQAYLNYTWGYSSTDIATKLIEFPQTVRFSQELVFGSGGFQEMMASFDKAFWARDYDSLSGFLRLFSARYITVIDDVMRRYLPDTNAPEIMGRVLAEEAGISAPTSVLNAKVYENISALPHIYAAPVAKAVYGGPEAILTISNTQYATSPALLLMDEPEKELARLPAGSTDELIFTDSNLIDMVAGTIDAAYRILDLKDAGFVADEPGRYIVLARRIDRRPTEGAAISALLDGIEGVNQVSDNDSPEGMRWKTLGYWDISTGPHHLRLSRADGFSAVVAVPMRVWSEEIKRRINYISSYPERITHLAKTYQGEKTPRGFYSRGKGETVEALVLKGVSIERVTGFSEDYSKDPSHQDWVVINDAADIAHDSSGTHFNTCLSSGTFRAIKLLGANGAARTFNPEVYPFTFVEFESSPKGFYDIGVSIGIDDDGDGTMDEEVEAALYSASGEVSIYNLSDKLKERYGYPGRKKYVPVWIAFDVKKAATSAVFRGPKYLTVKKTGFFHELPVFAKADDTVTLGFVSIAGQAEGFRSITPTGGSSLMTIKEPMTDQADQKESAYVLPRIKQRKINPTRYIVDVDWNGSAPRPFWLVFNESYNDGWKAYVDDLSEGTAPVLMNSMFSAEGRYIEDHVTLNGYANGWWVDTGKSGRYEITIEYSPQRFFNRGVLLSAASAMLLIIGWPVAAFVRRKRDRTGGSPL